MGTKVSTLALSGLLAVCVMAAGVQAEPVQWWELDGNTDATVGVDGKLTGTATAAPDRNGKESGAVYLDRKNSFVTADLYSKKLTFKELTISLWTKLDDGSSSWRDWWALRPIGGGAKHDCRLELGSSKTIRIYQDGVGGGNNLAGTTTKMDDRKWHHIVVVMSASANSITLYVDGVQEGEKKPWSAKQGIHEFRFGKGFKQSDGLNAWYDDVAIWDVALPAESIVGLHDGTFTPATAPTEPSDASR